MTATPTQVAMVTGAASGIGLATADQLLAGGVTVSIVDVNEEVLRSSADHLRARHGDANVTTVVADLATATAAHEAVERTVTTFGRLDLMHLNAGTPGIGPIDSGTNSEMAVAVVSRNLQCALGPLLAGLGHLQKGYQPGVTVTSSLAGLVASPADPMYAASKHALVGLVRSLAPAQSLVRINAVCPSLVRTAMVGDLPDTLRVLEPKAVAQVVVAQLLGNATGEVLFVEAGTEPLRVTEPIISALQSG